MFWLFYKVDQTNKAIISILALIPIKDVFSF